LKVTAEIKNNNNIAQKEKVKAKTF